MWYSAFTIDHDWIDALRLFRARWGYDPIAVRVNPATTRAFPGVQVVYAKDVQPNLFYLQARENHEPYTG